MSGMDEDKSGELETFLFSRHVPEFCGGQQSFPTNESSNLDCRDVGDNFAYYITNPLNNWAVPPLSK